MFRTIAKKNSRFRHFTAGPLAAVLLASFLATAPCVAAGKKDKRVSVGKTLRGRLSIRELSQEEAILHALNRLGFGPRPGETEQLRAMGLEKWIQNQLHPESLEDSAVAARLQRFPTLAMSTRRMLEEFPTPQMAARRMGLTPEQYRKQLEERVRPRRDPNAPAPRLDDLQGPQKLTAELATAKLIRAIYSQRQLNEMMVDFWFNHFNVFAGKGADRWLLTSYERDAIRPNALGKFKDLLGATAKSPAMLFYLDNWLSADPKAAAQGRRRGLNENYGRELLELHTLGVEGGYTQQDVIEVARCFTGWTLRNLYGNPEFQFDERIHDRDPKTVLGKRIVAGGMKDGEQVLEMLARHPNTARFISTKLARRFVADDPPPALVNRMARTFLKTDGDIRAVLRAMIYAPEFWAPVAYRAKIKKPFELVASAARALAVQVDEPLPLVFWIARIGEAPYQCQPPTGYPDKAEAWVNTGALLNRLNFALALAGNRLRGTSVDWAALVGPEARDDPQRALARVLDLFLPGQVSPQTRTALEKQLSDPQVKVFHAGPDDPAGQANLSTIAGLVLGSPEFQRR